MTDTRTIPLRGELRAVVRELDHQSTNATIRGGAEVLRVVVDCARRGDVDALGVGELEQLSVALDALNGGRR